VTPSTPVTPVTPSTPVTPVTLVSGSASLPGCRLSLRGGDCAIVHEMQKPAHYPEGRARLLYWLEAWLEASPDSGCRMIIQCCCRRGMPSKWLARRCRISDSTMSMIRAGQRLPTRDQAAALHAATGGEIPMEWE
jgi:hypothetical protein